VSVQFRGWALILVFIQQVLDRKFQLQAAHLKAMRTGA
jgi:hypothetical protein